jgi:hypothetical protein
MRDSSKTKGKSKKSGTSPSKQHLSPSMSSQENDAGASEENVEDDDDVVIKVDSASSKISVDKSSRRTRFWFFGGGSKPEIPAVKSDDQSKIPDSTSKLTRHKSLSGGREPSASPSVSVTTPHVTRVNSSNSKNATPTPKSRKAPSRFSLRRLFYGNPLLAQPFLQGGFGSGSASSQPGPSSSTSNQRRGFKGSASSGKMSLSAI